MSADDKFKHWYLVSYKLANRTGHTHIGLDACWLPCNTRDIIVNIADSHNGSPYDVVITSVFYMGYVPKDFEDNE